MDIGQETEKRKILIADDSEMDRSILADILGEEFEILEAANGVEVVSLFQKYGMSISLLLLDMVMPRMDGFEVLTILNRTIKSIPVVMVSSEENVSRYVERAYALGVADYIIRPFDALVVYRRITNIIRLYSKQQEEWQTGEQENFAKTVHYEELPASRRTLELLERERIKYQFFAAMSEEMQFEYTIDPPLLRISEYGSKRFNVPELLPNPQKNLLSVLGEENYLALSESLHKAPPSDPIVQFECEMNMGEMRWCRIICRALLSKEDPPLYMGAIGKVTDIHEEHMRMLDLQHAASHDSLTGICNHAHAREKIINLLQNCSDKKFALAVFDIDHFKQVNDLHGHMFGDEVLKYTAKKLRDCTQEGNIFARIGGDEFLIFMEYEHTPDAQVDRIFRALSGEYEGVSISISMGVADTELLGRDYDVLFRCADKALYAGKRAGRGNYRFYDVTIK